MNSAIMFTVDGQKICHSEVGWVYVLDLKDDQPFVVSHFSWFTMIHHCFDSRINSTICLGLDLLCKRVVVFLIEF